MEEKAIYGIINLDETFYKYSSGYDIRVIYKDNGLPYFLTEDKIETKKGYKKPKVYYRLPMSQNQKFHCFLSYHFHNPTHQFFQVLSLPEGHPYPWFDKPDVFVWFYCL